MTIADLTDCRVLVTGGSGAIGRATCTLFAEHGARIAVHYASNESAARDVIGALHGEGHLLVRADLAAGGAHALIESTLEGLGGIDVLVNNAGVFEPHPVLETSPHAWQASWTRLITTNLIGAADLIHAVAPHMVAAGGGRIVNVSSRAGFSGAPGAAAYAARKAGLNSLSQSMAQALAPHQVYVTAVAPGYVDAGVGAAVVHGPRGAEILKDTPLGRVASAEEVARMIVFLATPGTESTIGAIVDLNGASHLRS